jgi:hypothetical protein
LRRQVEPKQIRHLDDFLARQARVLLQDPLDQGLVIEALI